MTWHLSSSPRLSGPLLFASFHLWLAYTSAVMAGKKNPHLQALTSFLHKGISRPPVTQHMFTTIYSFLVYIASSNMICTALS